MTFIEAARAVLDQEGRPLRSREIAERAVAMGLLSHVGKTPVQTMSARLSATVAKDDSPFVRVRPGVFGLTVWQGNPPGPKKPPTPKAVPAPPPAARPVTVATPNDRHDPTSTGEPAAKTETSAPKSSEASAAQPRSAEASQTKRRKRKKRKASQSPAAVAAAVNTGADTRAPETRGPEPSTSSDRSSKSVTSPAEPSSQPSPQTPPPSLPPETDETALHKQGPSSEASAGVTVGPSVQVGETHLGDLLNRVESVLRRNSRPIPTEKILEVLGLKGESGPALLDALMASDAIERERRGQRPRFVKHRSGLALVERETSSEIVALENQGAELRTRLIHIAEKQLIRKLRTMPMGAFMRVMITYLQRTGFGAMLPVNFHRNGEFHLSVQDRRHQGRFCTGVILRKDSADFVVRERAVMDLRGTLHHYDAMNGMILTTGQVSEKAIREGRIPNLPPVALMDGETLAREMVELGIGVKVRTLSLPTFDDAFFSNIEP